MTFALMYEEDFLRHRSTGMHPECPERLISIWNTLSKHRIVDSCDVIPARFASSDELARAHNDNFVKNVIDELSEGFGNLDPDTYFSPGSQEAALKAAGGAIDTAFAVLDGKVEAAFALPRPPGHHATVKRSMGFCIFNNIAIAAHALLAAGVERILIFDWDVHHGNGTQDIFYDDPRVLFISVHQWPHYPGTGRILETGSNKGQGFTINLPFPSGATDADYLAVMNLIVEPAAKKFKPQITLVSAGFDAHEKDPLGGMRVTSNGFAHMAERITEIAKQTGKGPCYMLEGGYNLEFLSESVLKVIEATNGDIKPQPISGIASTQCMTIIDDVLKALG